MYGRLELKDFLALCNSIKQPPDNIATSFLDAFEEFDGCPIDLITDLGTENVIIAAAPAFFRDDGDNHRYVPSPRNQRIEACWGLFSNSCSTSWINFFKDLTKAKKERTKIITGKIISKRETGLVQ